MNKLSEEIATRIFRGRLAARSFSHHRTPSTPPSSDVDQISAGVGIIRRIGDVVIAATHTKATVGGETVLNHKNDKWVNKGRLLAIFSGNGRHFKEDMISFENLYSGGTMNAFCMARHLGRLMGRRKTNPDIEIVLVDSYDQSLEGAALIRVQNNKTTVTKLDITSPYFMGGCKAVAERLYRDIARQCTHEPDAVKNAKLVMKQTLCEVVKVDEATGGYISVSDSRTNKSALQWAEKGIPQFKWPAREWIEAGSYD